MATEIDRFEAKYIPEPNSGCWLWIGGFNVKGYGQLWRSVERRLQLAHRFAFETFVGPLVEGLHVCHRCDNRACVNPDHLFLGTPAENTADMMAKGRDYRGEARKGEAVASSRLSEGAVREIRSRHAAGQSGRSLARAFGVSKTSIAAIVARRTWSHV